MGCRIDELKSNEVVSIKDGCVLGYVSDVELDVDTGELVSIIIMGKPRLFGILGREEDIIISWKNIKVIGNETVLVSPNDISLSKGK